MKAGPITVSITLAAGTWASVNDFRVDLVTPGDWLILRLTAADAHFAGDTISWQFDQPELVFTVTAQFFAAHVSSDVSIQLPFRLDCDI